MTIDVWHQIAAKQQENLKNAIIDEITKHPARFTCAAIKNDNNYRLEITLHLELERDSDTSYSGSIS